MTIIGLMLVTFQVVVAVLYIVGAVLFGLPASVKITELCASTTCKMIGTCRWWIVLSVIPVFFVFVATYPLWMPWAISRAVNGDERFVPDESGIEL